MPGRPDAEFQLAFLDHIQRLLDEGGFVATYKYALLAALADLSVERGDDDGGALPLDAKDLARKFILYYAPQVRPYAGARTVGRLHQNTGRQARIINLVLQAQSTYTVGGQPLSPSVLAQKQSLVSDVAGTVATMPLWKLQIINGKVDDFLYPQVGSGRQLELKPGIAYCFRRFHGFVLRLAQDAWIRFIREREQNVALLGDSRDLGAFLFGADRRSLQGFRPLLEDLQSRSCFYCEASAKAGEVDHFVPWSWYSLDLGHNFVLACRDCNTKKSWHLAAPVHLEKWMQRNSDRGRDMADFFTAHNLPHDNTTTVMVARWAYERVAGNAGSTWVRGAEFSQISAHWVFPMR